MRTIGEEVAETGPRMTEGKQKKIIEILLEKMNKLKDSLKQAEKQLIDDSTNNGDTIVAEARITNLKKCLEKYRLALAKASQGIYGRCEECRKPIPERLLKVPPAALCVDCKNLKNQKTIFIQ